MPTLEALPTTLGLAAYLPALALLWLVVTLDHRPKAPLRVWGAFALGTAAIFLLRYVRLPGDFAAGLTNDPAIAVTLRALIGIAIPEETVKVLMIALLVLPRHKFEIPMDGLVVGAAVGLGFATYENLSYLVHHIEDWKPLAVVRDVLTVPFHGALGLVAGAYLTGARFGKAFGGHPHGRWSVARLILFAWLVPVILHAAFDAPLLALRDPTDNTTTELILLRVAGLGVGFGAIALAARFRWRVAMRQRSIVTRAQRIEWHGVWGILIAGGTAGFVGATLLATAGIRWVRSDAIKPVALAAGLALLAFAMFVFRWGRMRLVARTRTREI